MASAAAAAVQPLDRTRARRKAAWRRRRLVLLLMSPWLVGFSVFFGYPLVMSVYLSFTHYDLLSSAEVDRHRELPVSLHPGSAGRGRR